jgi:dihydroorotate dehydrogenase
MSLLHGLATRALRRMDPEAAHRLTLRALEAGLGPRVRGAADPVLETRLGALRLPNPVGLAAGFDKNAQVPGAMLAAGFGFVECGTVTPLPQTGNPTPRLFRLTEDRAVINRLGFNNEGLEAMAARLANRPSGVVGANVGANKDSPDRIGDYVTGLR